MICREYSQSEKPAWLLISQVEHARLSAALARHWIGFGADTVLRELDGTNEVPRQVLAAIEHHDDGWKRWEETPEMDLQKGRPLSYRGEVALEKVLVIWSDSIVSTRQFGPLAGWIVARHFLFLLKVPEPRGGEADRWRDEMEQNCAVWLSDWLATDSRHTTELANRAVAFIQLFDLLSLWLCCDCPIPGGDSDESPSFAPFRLRPPTGDLGTYHFTPLPGNSAEAGHDEVRETQKRRITVNPFPFDAGSLSLDATGTITPKMPSMHWRQMATNRWPFTLAWEFVASPWGGP